MRKIYIVVLLLVMPSLVSCAKQNTINTESAAPKPSVISEETNEPEPTGFPNEYFDLVESYMEESVFQTMNNDRIKTLSDLLKGHYDIIGRTDGGDLEYYLAVRREDAPIYEDFDSINVGYTDRQFYIGYYDDKSEPTILYELNGYDLFDMPLGSDSLDCFCIGIYGVTDVEENPSFSNAFSENGRKKLDFMKSKPELSFYKDTMSYVRFYYQDEDTIEFYSEPYPCYISLTDEEQENIRSKLSTSRVEEGIETFKEASAYLSKKGNVCSTGTSLHIDGRNYMSFGNHDLRGYMMVSSEDENEFLSLEYNEDIYQFMMEKVQNAVGMDYGNFDPAWFQTPLQSASIEFLEYMGIDDAYDSKLRTQTIEDKDKLDALSKLMDQAISSGECGFSACPYVAPIDFIREDGETLRIFVATDSCDSISYEGRIGFQYGEQTDLAAIFDEAMAYRLKE